MWSWDQGRLDYFDFDNLRKIAKYAQKHDLKQAKVTDLFQSVGLPFKPNKYPIAWRNYSRIFKSSLIVYEEGGRAVLSPVGAALASDGVVTTEEYFHLLVCATTEPSPALKDWNVQSKPRYPLLFALKFLLARLAKGSNTTDLNRILNAYNISEGTGEEGQEYFLGIAETPSVPMNHRQAKESIRVISQISYLSMNKDVLTVSLHVDDALEIFNQLNPIGGNRNADGNQEIKRISKLFNSFVSEFDFEYTNTVLSDTAEAGFSEGGKAAKTHLVIERNSQLRKSFFNKHPTAVCDFCGKDTAEMYPWQGAVLDVHHLLPLCSGARAAVSGTMLDDLVANCPTCHRAVHSFYQLWLKAEGKKDFADSQEAKLVYDLAKSKHKEAINAENN